MRPTQLTPRVVLTFAVLTILAGVTGAEPEPKPTGISAVITDLAGKQTALTEVTALYLRPLRAHPTKQEDFQIEFVPALGLRLHPTDRGTDATIDLEIPFNELRRIEYVGGHVVAYEKRNGERFRLELAGQDRPPGMQYRITEQHPDPAQPVIKYIYWFELVVGRRSGDSVLGVAVIAPMQLSNIMGQKAGGGGLDGFVWSNVRVIEFTAWPEK